METWVIYTAIYAVLNGFYECGKKKAAEKNSVYEVLALMTGAACMLAILTCKNVFDVHPFIIFAIFIKSLIVVIAWAVSLYVVKEMTMSLYGVVNLSRILFTIAMSAMFLGENLTITTILGMIMVILGLFLVNRVANSRENKETSLKNIFILIGACVLHSCAAIIDKKVLTVATGDQMQFWFLLFVAILCWLILLVREKKLDLSKFRNNYWAIGAGVCLLVQDKFLFTANGVRESQVAIMTLIKQVSAIEAIIFGKIFFKEEKIIKKILCSILIIVGIAIAVL